MKTFILPALAFTGALTTEAAASGGDPRWWVVPGQSDWYAWVGLIIFFLAIFLVVHLYSQFDHYAEHRAKGTPLRTTIPTILTIALAYEIMPALDHFSILLPTALILTAIARDFMLWWRPDEEEAAQ
ncbi:hypothetical protein [Roseibium sp. MMSF_3544]|uniref:hypothetical protein n=1 Tax=unclassified Roseibium TaxID=2629323 RepID=UPI00273E9276|nr:hypothetical protein [Roseibium sp. MMSF_3544]